MKHDALFSFKTSLNAACRLPLKKCLLRFMQNFRFLRNSKYEVVVIMQVNGNETLRFI